MPRVPSISPVSAVNEERFSGRRFERGESRLTKALALIGTAPEGGRVLDVAAGSGLAAAELQAKGWSVTALDISEELCRQIAARDVHDVRRHDLAAGPLPLESGSVDAIFAGEIIEHLVDTGAFVAELRRVLAPGGVVVITTPNLASLENRARLLVGRYPRWLEWELPRARRSRPYHDQGHVRGYTAATLRAQLEDAGLRVDRVVGNWVTLLPQHVLNDLVWPPVARTGDWLPTLSQGLIVRAYRSG